jgi:PIN domain nuclease of toxin-antitoxin system
LKYLLDTHTLLWWLDNNETLSELDAPDDLEDALEVNNFSHLPITIKDGLSIGALPLYHRDPFDRMLIAQALNRDLIIISRDSLFSQYQVKLILA